MLKIGAVVLMASLLTHFSQPGSFEYAWNSGWAPTVLLLSVCASLDYRIKPWENLSAAESVRDRRLKTLGAATWGVANLFIKVILAPGLLPDVSSSESLREWAPLLLVWVFLSVYTLDRLFKKYSKERNAPAAIAAGTANKLAVATVARAIARDVSLGETFWSQPKKNEVARKEKDAEMIKELNQAHLKLFQGTLDQTFVDIKAAQSCYFGYFCRYEDERIAALLHSLSAWAIQLYPSEPSSSLSKTDDTGPLGIRRTYPVDMLESFRKRCQGICDASGVQEILQKRVDQLSEEGLLDLVRYMGHFLGRVGIDLRLRPVS